MKRCLKCNLEKPIQEFPKHKTMKDGHLNKCKICVTSQNLDYEKRYAQNPEWIKKRNEKSRLWYHRNKKDLIKKIDIASVKRFNLKFPEKYAAQNAIRSFVKIKGMHFHHWSYNKVHYKDVLELSSEDHYKLHRHIVYDQERMMYRRCDTMELLDTKELHFNYYLSLKNKP